MEDYEPSYCDNMPLEKRTRDLGHYVLPDVETVTNQKVTLEKLIHAQTTLDIGCGAGAYARTIRDLGGRGLFVGIDPIKYSGGDDAYSEYADLIYQDIRNKNALEHINQRTYDCIISVGLPPQAVDFVARNNRRFKLTRGGLMVIITDDHVSSHTYSDFDVYHGELYIDESILVRK